MCECKVNLLKIHFKKYRSELEKFSSSLLSRFYVIFHYSLIIKVEGYLMKQDNII